MATSSKLYSETLRISRQDAAAGPGRDPCRSLDLRYAGQDYPLEISVERPVSTAGGPAQWKADFYQEYEALYGQVDTENLIEIAALRVQVRQDSPQPRIAGPTAGADAAPKAMRGLYVVNERAVRQVPVFERRQLRTGQSITGPAVVEERESTTIIGAGDRLVVDPHGCLSITVAPLLQSQDEDVVTAAEA